MPTNDQLLERIVRVWEGWVNEVEGAGNDSPEALKALDDSRTALLTILRDARVVVENPDSPRWEMVVGKALKDWATAIMENRGVTRAIARERIMDSIKLLTAREYPALTPPLDDESSDGGFGGIIQGWK